MSAVLGGGADNSRLQVGQWWGSGGAMWGSGGAVVTSGGAAVRKLISASTCILNLFVSRR